MVPLAVALSSRLDWGLGNPNKTATLIALLMIAIWALPSLPRTRWAKTREILWWLVLLGSLGLGYALLQTGSRGGMIAVFAGWLIILCFIPRPWPWQKIAGVLGGLVVLSLMIVVLPQTARLSPTYSLGDASIGNRWILWRCIPSMIVAAPGGWGLGNSGEAFMTWYQAADRDELYRTLVNSHGTWLVEMGWLGRIGYLGTWALAFCLAWPTRQSSGKRLPAIPLGILVVFAVAGLCSSVAETWVLWLIPIFALTALILARWRLNAWPKRITLVWSVVGSVVVVSAAIFILSGLLPIHAYDAGRSVQLGSGEPRLIIVAREGTKESPRSLRTVWQKTSSPVSALWTSHPENIPISERYTLALLGNWDQLDIEPLLNQAQRVILLAPSWDPGILPPEILAKTYVYFGEFLPPADEETWQKAGHFEILPGQGAFISDWPERLMRVAAQTQTEAPVPAP